MLARRMMFVADQMSISDKDYRELFLQSPIGRMLVSVEPDGRFVYAEANAAAAQYLGIPRERMLGCTPKELFESAVAEQVEKSLLSCVKTRKMITFNTLPRCPGGVRMQSFVLCPLFDAEGRVRLIDVMARPDTADSAQLQRERDDSMRLMTSMFDASGMGIVVTDHHGRIVLVNDAFLSEYGWERQDLLGEEFTVLLPPEDQAFSKKLHAAFIRSGRRGARELQLVRKDGRVSDIVLTMAMMELSQKRRFMVSTVRDVTERKNMMRNLKRAKEEADNANRAKSSFLANMSHELRTPLNAIIGFSELIKSEAFGPLGNPKYEEYMKDIHFSARHLLDIINDVLDMSKIEAGKVELIETEVAVTEVFNSVQRIMGDRAAAGSIALRFDTEECIPHIKADQRLVRQVLINLVSNAVKFSPPGKAVVIRAMTLSDNHIRMVVEDEGCGIPADKIKSVQEPFGQVSDARNYRGQGTGLGLPLARAMVELHDGLLTLESEEGKGTTVYIDFPAERTMAAREPRRPKE